MSTILNNKSTTKQKVVLAATVTTAVVTTIIVRRKINAYTMRIAEVAIDAWINDNYNNGFMVLLAPLDLADNYQLLTRSALTPAA